MVWKQVLGKCAIVIDLLVLSLRVQLSTSDVLPGTTLTINPSLAVINETITIECLSKQGDQSSGVVYSIKQDDRQIAFARFRCHDNEVLENKTCPGCNIAVISCSSFAVNNLVAQRKWAGNYKCEVTHITKGYEPFYGQSNKVLLSVGDKTPPVERLEVRNLADGRLLVDGATVEAGTNTSVACETNSAIPEPVFVVSISGRKNRTNPTIQNLTTGYRVAFHESVPHLPNVDYLCEVFNGFGTKQFKRISITAIYSPQTIDIFPRSSISCGDLDKSDNVEFEVISDDGNPVPNHSCTASSSSGVQLNMLMESGVYRSAARKLKSTWFCSNCSSVADLTVKCSTILSNGVNRTDEWNCVSLENVAISLENPVNCSCQDASKDMEFQLIYEYVGPVPNHSCLAWDIFGTQLTIEPLASQTKTTNNTVNSTWLCSNCNNVAQLIVKCRVTQSKRSDRSVEWKSECSECESSLGRMMLAFWHRNMAIIVSSLCSIAVSAAICLVIICKRVTQKHVTPQSINHRLVQFNTHATDISKPEAADLMASTGLQEQPHTFDFAMIGMMVGGTTKAP